MHGEAKHSCAVGEKRENERKREKSYHSRCRSDGSFHCSGVCGSGYEVVLYDVRGDAIAKGRELIHINQKAAKEEGYLTEAECEERLGRICFCESMECFRLADFVIEAIVENREIKKKFWGEISQLVSEDAILTSNTSGLSITDLAEAVERPERFCGLHWLNPPHICPLVEIICGTATTEKTVEKVREISIDVGKVPVVLKKEIPDFLSTDFSLQFCGRP